MTEPKNELQRNANTESRREELDVYQRALDVQWLNSRMEDGRMGRTLACIQQEAEMEKDFQERTDHATTVNKHAKKETALGREIANVQSEMATQQHRIHSLRESDVELKHMEKKLEAGYVSRDLKLQMLNNEYKKMQDKADDKIATDIVNNALLDDEKALSEEQKRKLQQTSQYSKDIQQQLVNRQTKKQCEYEDKLIERKYLDEVVKAMADEDHRELQHKRDQTDKNRKEMETFLDAREDWKNKHKQMIFDEEKRIEKQTDMVADRNSATVSERHRQFEIHDASALKMGNKHLADEAASQVRTDVIEQLHTQEHLEKYAQEDKAGREKIVKDKNDLREALTEQIATKKMQDKEYKERDYMFRQQSDTRHDADVERERREQQEKKQRDLLYQQDLLQQIQDNKDRRQKEKKDEERRENQVWEWDSQWQAEVANERRHMIQENVPELLGSLQAGVVKHEDLPAVRVGADKDEELKSLDVEGMGISDRPHRHEKCNEQCKELREY